MIQGEVTYEVWGGSLRIVDSAISSFIILSENRVRVWIIGDGTRYDLTEESSRIFIARHWLSGLVPK